MIYIPNMFLNTRVVGAGNVFITFMPDAADDDAWCRDATFAAGLSVTSAYIPS